MATKSNHGGARRGAGRKPGQQSDPGKDARQIRLRPELWAQLDEAQTALGLTRTSFYEKVTTEWLARNAEGKKV